MRIIGRSFGQLVKQELSWALRQREAYVEDNTGASCDRLVKEQKHLITARLSGDYEPTADRRGAVYVEDADQSLTRSQ